MRRKVAMSAPSAKRRRTRVDKDKKGGKYTDTFGEEKKDEKKGK